MLKSSAQLHKKILFLKVFQVELTVITTFCYRKLKTLHVCEPDVASVQHSVSSPTEEINSSNIHSFITEYGCFYSATSSPLLLRGTPYYSIDTVLELIRRSTTRNFE